MCIRDRYQRRVHGVCWVMDLTEFSQGDDKKKYTKKQLRLNIIDHWSKFAWSTVIQSKFAKVVAQFLEKITRENGYPKYIKSDSDTEFKGVVEQFCKNHKVVQMKMHLQIPIQQVKIIKMLVAAIVINRKKQKKIVIKKQQQQQRKPQKRVRK
eukprot:TRINITY_DN916_c0_g5_i1.p2 TRINITY_DN916_c0_g5~~TRINITY_DN916_c0_g5_i1.p2  ORF type:complete len:153 (+),score=31.31 TRINITY_DN916_c0_g5_i1:127-585(+)